MTDRPLYKELRRVFLDSWSDSNGWASMLLLTGARLREVMCAEWSWVDWQWSVLLVPAERGETGRLRCS